MTDDLYLALLSELDSRGVSVDDIAEIMYMRPMPKAALDVLLHHLDKGHRPGVQAAIVRCLADPQARALDLFEPMIENFIALATPKEPDELVLKESLALAAAYHARRTDLPTVLYALEQGENWRYVAWFVDKFRRHRFVAAGPFVLRTLMKLADKKGAARLFGTALAGMGYVEALPVLRALLPTVSRQEARAVETAITRLAAATESRGIMKDKA